MMKKGQAALEYLITYGWGFLVIIVAIGALAYFGLLSPTRYIPARCEFGAQLECVDYQLSVDTANYAHVKIQFRNNFGDDIQLVQLQTASGAGGIPAPVVIKKGNVSTTIDMNFTNGQLGTTFVKDDRISVPLIATFKRNTASSPQHNVTGEIFATVQ
jgi:hypothetical protein